MNSLDTLLVSVALLVTISLIYMTWRETVRDFTGYKIYKINGDLKKVKRPNGLNADEKEIDRILSRELPLEVKLKNSAGRTVEQVPAYSSILNLDKTIEGYNYDWVATIVKERTR